MSLARLLLRRVAAGLVAAWSVLTLVFLLFTATEDWQLSRRLAFAGLGRTDPEEIREIREEYLAARGLDRPLSEQYVDWMGNMVTLQWGESFRTGEAVFPAVAEATLRTAAYVVPAVALALGLGLLVGLHAATSDRPLLEGGVRGATYLGFGVPNFLVGAFALAAAAVGYRFRWRTDVVRPAELPFLFEYVLPVLLVTTTLTGAVVSYARAYSMQYAAGDVVKFVRAKGGGRAAVARHVLRNAAIPLVSLAFAETLALIALSVVVVEALFGIPGLGLLFYNAVWARDLPMMMGGTLVVVAGGVAGNVLQDVAYAALDPRVDAGTR